MVLGDEFIIVFKYFWFFIFFDVLVCSWWILLVMCCICWIWNVVFLYLFVCLCWVCFWLIFVLDLVGIIERKYNKFFINCCFCWLFFDLYILWYMIVFKLLLNRFIIYICIFFNNFIWLLVMCFLFFYICFFVWDCIGNCLYGVILFFKFSRLYVFNV